MAHPSFNTSELANHLGVLYRFAQSLTADPSEAAALVDATYRRASRHINRGATPQEPLTWLLQLLSTEYEEGQYRTNQAASFNANTGFRQQALSWFVRRATPVAFSALSPTHRSLLMLCKVERLSCADAADVIDSRPDAACAELTNALDSFRNKLYAQASAPEQSLLDRYLTDEVLKEALVHFAENSFSSPPSPLAPLVESTLRQTPTAKLTAEKSRPALPAAPPNHQDNGKAIQDRWAGRARQFALVLILVAFAAAVGYGTSELFETPTETNVLALSIQQAHSVQAQQTITQPSQAAAYVQGELGIRVTPPNIDQATLQGVDISEVTSDVRVPVFLYYDEVSGQRFPVYAYTYAQLSHYADQLDLSTNILRRIEDDRQIIAEEIDDGGSTLIWRHRDKIFVTIPPGDPGNLRARITPAG